MKKNFSTETCFKRKLDFTYDKSLVPLSTFMYILKQNQKNFITTWKQYTESKKSLPLHISHWVRFQTRIKAIRGSRYCLLQGIWTLGKFGETGPKYPKSHGVKLSHIKYSKVFSSRFHIQKGLPLVSKPTQNQVIYLLLEYWALNQFGETGPKYPELLSAGTNRK